MSAEIFEEVDYNQYLIESYWNRLEPDSTSLLREEGTGPHTYDFDSYPKLTAKEALDVLEYIYQKNSYLLYKEPWYKLLFERLKKDIKKGFVSMIKIEPTLFQKTMHAILPVLKLFSKMNLFTQVLNDTKLFYETILCGCYSVDTNKMMIVVQYNNASQINLDMLKIILHEYCHFYARKKHTLYVNFFKGMLTKFYTGLIDGIDFSFKLNLTPAIKKQLLDSIMKWNFYKLDNIKLKKHNFEKCVEEMGKIHPDFTNAYVNMLISRIQYKSDSDTFVTSNECMRRAYLAISDEVTSQHIINRTYCYQEYYCADEVVAIMSFYKPNYKPYIQMIESLV